MVCIIPACMLIYPLLLLFYTGLAIGLSVYGFNALLLGFTFVAKRYAKRVKTGRAIKVMPDQWPHVTVQLPLYNERFVCERLLKRVAQLDYPREQLTIQLLDDSTDQTTSLLAALTTHFVAQGFDIQHVRREDRVGYKAGALAYGMTQSDSQFFAIFDADFLPQPSFLKDVIPYFDKPAIGMVQTRWAHLNSDQNALTRAQSLAIDGHFVVEQTVRSRTGLLFSFNGSGGVWRRTCIDSAGGWKSDTLAEDLDLSYRAKLAGWQFSYCPQIEAPAEIPESLTAFKRQQFRWAKGSIQTARKLLWPLLCSDQSVIAKLHGALHLTGYFVHPMMIMWVLLSLPLSLTGVPSSLPLSLVGIAGAGPPLVYFLGQVVLYRRGGLRFIYFPFLLLLGTGIAVNNTHAIVEALLNRKPNEFLRTPKFSAAAAANSTYQLKVNWTVWAELGLALYALIAMLIAVRSAPELVFVQIMFGSGFLYVGLLGLRDGVQQWTRRWQQRRGLENPSSLSTD